MRLVFLVTIVFAAACGDDSPQVSCSGDAECNALAPDLGGGPRCCSGYCVFPSAGCDSGVRYITGGGNFGACVATSQCAPADMAMTPPPPKDFAMSMSHD